MKHFLAVVLCIAIPLAVFGGDSSYKVTYDGGSLPNLKSGTGLHLFIQQDKVRLVRDGNEVASIPAAAITEVSYGQDVHRRVGAAIGLAFVSLGVGALMALSKSKKHFVICRLSAIPTSSPNSVSRAFKSWFRNSRLRPCKSRATR